MYVCICHAVTDREIARQAEEGVRTMRQLRAATGCSGSCGRCAREAKTILDARAVAARRPDPEDGLLVPTFA